MAGTHGLTHLSPRKTDAGIDGQFPEADNNAMGMRNDFPQAFLSMVAPLSTTVRCRKYSTSTVWTFC